MTDYDVAVVGGRSAGVAAAVAASRCGAHTLLIERDVLADPWKIRGRQLGSTEISRLPSLILGNGTRLAP